MGRLRAVKTWSVPLRDRCCHHTAISETHAHRETTPTPGLRDTATTRSEQGSPIPVRLTRAAAAGRPVRGACVSAFMVTLHHVQPDLAPDPDVSLEVATTLRDSSPHENLSDGRHVLPPARGVGKNYCEGSPGRARPPDQEWTGSAAGAVGSQRAATAPLACCGRSGTLPGAAVK